MLPNDPNWLSADSALWAAIFAGLSFIATTTGVVVAWKALRWARKAAQEAGKQAIAALDAANWAEKAAEAAQDQIRVLEKQLELSEPRPVIILKIEHSSIGDPSLQYENVGEFIAVELRLSDMPAVQISDAEKVNLHFLSEMIVKPRDGRALRYTEQHGRGPLSKQVTFKQIFAALETEARSKNILPDAEGRTAIRLIEIGYKNVRGRSFTDEFVLGTRSGKFDCWPALPLFLEKGPLRKQ